jgi:hypothetical protein
MSSQAESAIVVTWGFNALPSEKTFNPKLWELSVGGSRNNGFFFFAAQVSKIFNSRLRKYLLARIQKKKHEKTGVRSKKTNGFPERVGPNSMLGSGPNQSLQGMNHVKNSIDTSCYHL